MAPRLLDVRKIWDHAAHNALTDLIFYHGCWWCVFRESDTHVGGINGVIRLLTSADGENWTSAALFADPGVDWRDPKLSITPDARLMLLAEGVVYKNKNYLFRQPWVAFSSDGLKWTPFQAVLSPHEWLWRLTWHDQVAYGVSYFPLDPTNKKSPWGIKLFKSADGIDYTHVSTLDVPGDPNETTLRFLPSGEMIALVRRGKSKALPCWIGKSAAPYQQWTWQEASHHLGGPNFIITPRGEFWAAGRIVTTIPRHTIEKMALVQMTEQDLRPLFFLPSGGDCSYPGMVLQNNLLWISYYSSHAGPTAVYLARIQYD